MKLENKKVVVPIILTMATACLLGATHLYVSHHLFIGDAVMTEGEIIDHVIQYDEDEESGVTYIPKFQFTTQEGEEIIAVGQVAFNPPRYGRGDTVPIGYQADNPKYARIDDNSINVFVIVFGGSGVMMILVLWRLLYLDNRYSEQVAYLQSVGKRIDARVTYVGQMRSYVFNGEHPYIVIAEYYDEAKDTVYVFDSEYIWFDPRPYTGETVPVLVDPQDYTTYHIDTSFLPKLA